MRAALRLLLPVLLIGLCLWAFEAAEIGTRLAAADPVWIAAAVLLLLGQTVLMALRWRLVARCLGIGMPLGWALREYLASQALNATLPGGVLGDAARAVRTRAGPAGLKGAAQAVVVERAAGQVGLAAVLAIGLAVATASGALPGMWLAALAAGLVTLAVAAVLAASSTRLAALGRRCLPTRRVAAVQAGLSLGAAVLNVAAFAACAKATGTDLPAGSVLVLVPLILTAMLIPLTVGGWGWREGAAAALFPLAGAAPEAGVAAGIAFGATILLATLPFAAVALSGRPSRGVRSIDDAGKAKVAR
ncbi:lysylphosphatidylglycerol synthase transmembrane domain-containing protein [Jannaschia formosa]|uniref:lysylphosphatidylglycerol synthase transmembrane domain-containing protein n=1 Tax=Jannaschia formosa TaxID=2259592 RepID=UPI000E1BD175|nr:lysylphosphatidylglycerol synthase transmembrane domain-containing protein [Jannaschia formosa]TFL18374.1 flippase-like domain-containing protein [Jannaschia formosa]